VRVLSAWWQRHQTCYLLLEPPVLTTEMHRSLRRCGGAGRKLKKGRTSADKHIRYSLPVPIRGMCTCRFLTACAATLTIFIIYTLAFSAARLSLPRTGLASCLPSPWKKGRACLEEGAISPRSGMSYMQLFLKGRSRLLTYLQGMQKLFSMPSLLSALFSGLQQRKKLTPL